MARSLEIRVSNSNEICQPPGFPSSCSETFEKLQRFALFCFHVPVAAYASRLLEPGYGAVIRAQRRGVEGNRIMNRIAQQAVVALAICLVIAQSVAIAQNLGAAPQVNVAVQGQTGGNRKERSSIS